MNKQPANENNALTQTFGVTKIDLFSHVISELKATIKLALAAAEQARQTATHSENVAENKYDTLGLEAAYLAHGQSQRVLDLEDELKAFEALCADDLVTGEKSSQTIQLGSVIKLVSGDSKAGEEVAQWYLMGPNSGGLKLQLNQHDIIVITPQAPLGAKLMGLMCFDEISIEIQGNTIYQEISTLY